MPFPYVNPGDKFKPSASLSNAVRRHLNEANGFKGGVIASKNAQIIRVPIYNATSSDFVSGQAVSLKLDGSIKGDCYPAVVYSDDNPCYGVCLSMVESGGMGDCVLSGIASVTISGSNTTGKFATPKADGSFERADYGVPIVNISGSKAVVMLGNITSEGGGSSAVLGFPDYSTAYAGWHGDDFSLWNQDHTAPFDCWLEASAVLGLENNTGSGSLTLVLKYPPNYYQRYFPLASVSSYEPIYTQSSGSILLPLSQGMRFNLTSSNSGNVIFYGGSGVVVYACL